MCGIAYLIEKTYNYDSIGNPVSAETKREILTFEKSITRGEWTAAGRNGLNPAVCLTTARINYSGETEIEYEGKRYSIYRTYEIDEDIELYLERKGGLNGEQQNDNN